MTDYEKMQSGEIYDPNNEDIFKVDDTDISLLPARGLFVRL